MKRIQTVVFENLLAYRFLKFKAVILSFTNIFLIKYYGEKGRVIDSYKKGD